MAPPKVIDVDTTDEFLDLPEPRYEDGKLGATGKELDRLADPAYRRAHGLPPLPVLPPLTER